MERLQRLGLAAIVRADGPALDNAAPELGLPQSKVKDLAANCALVSSVAKGW